MKTSGTWIVALCAFSASAQDLPQFKSDVTNIFVNVLVKSQGRVLEGLKQDDFVVRDEGESRSIAAFEPNTTPLDLVLLIDTSRPPAWPDSRKIDKNLHDAAVKAARRIRPQDRTAVISFGFDPRLEQDLTADPETELATTLQKVHTDPHEPRRILAIHWAAWLFAADSKAKSGISTGRKKAILMITSGLRYMADLEDDPAIQQLLGMDIAFYAIVIPTPPVHFSEPILDPRIGNIEDIARATGGEVVADSAKDPLQSSLPDLFDRIQSTYSLWYSPPAAKSGEFRHIKVELSDEAKKRYPDVEIKAREGYIAR